jgi:hypothetical protein
VSNPLQPGLIQRLEANIDLALSLPFQVRLWEAQNAYYKLMQEYAGQVRERGQNGDAEALSWIESFTRLGEKLKIKVEVQSAVAASPS